MTGTTAVHDVAVGTLRSVPDKGEAAEAVREAVADGLLVVGPGSALDLTDDGRAVLGLSGVGPDGGDIGGEG